MSFYNKVIITCESHEEEEIILLWLKTNNYVDVTYNKDLDSDQGINIVLLSNKQYLITQTWAYCRVNIKMTWEEFIITHEHNKKLFKTEQNDIYRFLLDLKTEYKFLNNPDIIVYSKNIFDKPYMTIAYLDDCGILLERHTNEIICIDQITAISIIDFII